MGPSDVGKCLCCWSKRSCMHLHQCCISPGLFGQPCCRARVGTATGAQLGLETFSLLRLCQLPKLQYPSIMSPSTHIPVLSIPAGMYHSPAQPAQHKRRCKQYFLLFYTAPRGCTPHANGTAKGNSWWHRSQSFLHLGLSPAFTKQVWDLCWIWHCCAWPRLWLSKGMVLCTSPAALVVPEHLMQEGLWSDLAWFSYVWAHKAGMPGLDCSMPFWDSSAWKIREAQFLLHHYEDGGLNCMKIKYWGGTKWGGWDKYPDGKLGSAWLTWVSDWALLSWGWVWTGLCWAGSELCWSTGWEKARAAGWRQAGGLERCLQSSLVGIQSGKF